VLDVNTFIYRFSPFYRNSILKYHNISYITPNDNSSQCKVYGFEFYNSLIDINKVFSNAPTGDIIDRTQTIRFPFNMHICRKWKTPKNNLSLEECFQRRVQDLEKTGPINILWSGGIVSTAVIVGFLKYSTDLTKIRVLYSTYSVKENPNFYYYLLENPQVDMIEFSGDYYLNQTLDGTFVSGDGIDDLTASMDESFIEKYGYEILSRPWQDLYYHTINSDGFIENCEKFNNLCGRPIDTVLEARWWFYTNCKIQKFPSQASSILNDNQPLVVGFYDDYSFEGFMFFNMDKIMPDSDYRSYKKFLKEFIFNFNNDSRYYQNKKKTSSMQLPYYYEKRLALNGTEYILLLGDGTRIRTPNLPLLSEHEYRDKYGDSLDYLFNTP